MYMYMYLYIHVHVMAELFEGVYRKAQWIYTLHNWCTKVVAEQALKQRPTFVYK